MAENRTLYRNRAAVLTARAERRRLAGGRAHGDHVPLGAHPRAFQAMGAVDFAAELLEKAGVAVAPGVGFGAGGEGFVRFSLIEPDDRVRQAAAQIGKLLKS